MQISYILVTHINFGECCGNIRSELEDIASQLAYLHARKYFFRWCTYLTSCGTENSYNSYLIMARVWSHIGEQGSWLLKTDLELNVLDLFPLKKMLGIQTSSQYSPSSVGGPCLQLSLMLPIRNHILNSLSCHFHRFNARWDSTVNCGLQDSLTDLNLCQAIVDGASDMNA